MSDYMPRTQDVKNCYVYAASTPDGQTVKPERTLRHEFDRWLAKYTQEAVDRGAERERARVVAKIEREARLDGAWHDHHASDELTVSAQNAWADALRIARGKSGGE